MGSASSSGISWKLLRLRSTAVAFARTSPPLRALDVAGDGALLVVVGERRRARFRRRSACRTSRCPRARSCRRSRWSAATACRGPRSSRERAASARRRRADRASGRRRSRLPASVPTIVPLSPGVAVPLNSWVPPLTHETSPSSGREPSAFASSSRRSLPPSVPCVFERFTNWPDCLTSNDGPADRRLGRGGRRAAACPWRARAACRSSRSAPGGRSRRRSTAEPSCPRPPMTTIAATMATATRQEDVVDGQLALGSALSHESSSGFAGLGRASTRVRHAGNTSRAADRTRRKPRAPRTPEWVAGRGERRYVRRVATRQLTVSIALADDHAVVRSGLRMLLESEPGFEVVAEAGDARGDRRGSSRTRRRTCSLLDVHMRGGASLDLIPALAASTRVLVLTMQDDPGYARTAMRAGARGYVLKEAEDAELVQAVRTVAAGGTYLDPALGGKLLAADDDGDAARRLTDARARGARPDRARPHERRDGEALYLSLRTVETHRANIHRKLGTDSRAELVRTRSSWGWSSRERRRADGSRLESLALEGARAAGAAHDLADVRGARRAACRPWAVRGRWRSRCSSGGFALRLVGRRPRSAHRQLLHRADRAARDGLRGPRRARAAAFALLLVWAWGEFRTSRARPARLLDARRGVRARRRAGRLLRGAAAGATSRSGGGRRPSSRSARTTSAVSNAELTLAVTRLEAFAEIARAVGGETELRTVLDRILEHGRAIVGARTLVAYLEETASSWPRRPRTARWPGCPPASRRPRS